MQRIRFSCEFCKDYSNETMDHIFAELVSLEKARDLMSQYVKRLGVCVPEDIYQISETAVFCLGFTPDDESK